MARIPNPYVTTTRIGLTVRGSRVAVRALWRWHREGAAVETILRRYPHLGPANVLGALAFAYENQAEVNAELAAEAEMIGRAGSGPSEAGR